MRKRREVFFFEKKKQKTFGESGLRTTAGFGAPALLIKVFCFFFSKKKTSLAFLVAGRLVDNVGLERELEMPRAWILASSIGFVTMLGGAALAEPPADHASDTTVILESTVKSVDWSGPQLAMTLAVAAGTSPTADWTIAGPAWLELLRRGWNKDDIKPGAQFSAVVAPDPHQRRSGTLLEIVYNGGRTLAAGKFGLATLMPADGVAPDPDLMEGHYGNTEICSSAKFECHVWFYPNHRFIMFSRDLQPDGSWSIRGLEGADWAEKVDGQYIGCMVFDNRPIAPLCHSPLAVRRVGDHWTAFLANGTQEQRHLVAGHQ